MESRDSEGSLVPRAPEVNRNDIDDTVTHPFVPRRRDAIEGPVARADFGRQASEPMQLA